MRDWLLRDLLALAAGVPPRVSTSKQGHSPPDVARIVATTANRLQCRGRLGSAIMRLPVTMDTPRLLEYLRGCGVLEDDAASDRVVSALAVSAKRPQCRPGIVAYTL
jgi:hypothetical protein